MQRMALGRNPRDEVGNQSERIVELTMSVRRISSTQSHDLSVKRV